MANPTPEVFAQYVAETSKQIVGTHELFQALCASMAHARASFYGVTRCSNNRRFTWVGLSPIVVRSRNEREGRYAGKHNGRHVRAKL